MADEQSIQAHRDECIKAAAATIVRVAMNLVYSDPHMWSTRGCATCKSVTALLGEPFGCDRYRSARARATPSGSGGT